MRKSGFVAAWLGGLLLLALLLTGMQTAVSNASPLAETPEPWLYLPLIQRQFSPSEPPPEPPTTTMPTVTTHTVTIRSYDLEAGFIPTEPGDFVYPYPRLNHDWVRQRPTFLRELTAVTLENAYTAVTILPELGGRVYSWVDKSTGRQLLYQNPVLKPTSWGWRGWWLATGGIEWAFPVDEHGLNEWRPWTHTILSSTHAISVTVQDVESQTGMTVGATVSLDADHAWMTLTPWVENNTADTHDYQYWLNAMIALQDNHVSPQMQFIVPAEQVLVHATQDPQLPQAKEMMPWPVVDGRSLDSYGEWTHYLGFFAPQVTAGYSAIYDHGVRQGALRLFDPAHIPGTKFFGMGNLGPELWTDDDSTYAEMWSSGVTPDFWTYTPIDPGARVSWQERWLPVHDFDAIDYANETAVLHLNAAGNPVTLSVAVTHNLIGTVRLIADDVVQRAWPAVLTPAAPFHAEWERPSPLTGTLKLQLVDETGVVLAETE